MKTGTPDIFTETLPSGFAFRMIGVEGGTFRMGLPEGAEGAYGDEHPDHEVLVPPFSLGEYPVTQGLWLAVMGGKNPSYFPGLDRPAEQVSWEDAQAFIAKLNGLTGRGYRLPSEAEWEYAARGGARSEGYLYAGSDKLKEAGWYDENSGGETHPVGQKLPNELGLYDMSGNVWEWCEDDWHDTYTNAPADGSAWVEAGRTGLLRVLRGGSWGLDARLCRVSYRDPLSPGRRDHSLGFRLAAPPVQRR
ncbi:MAG: formylglycine-generating enzyme family protein [Bacteroidia bacterium]|nr:formylglycine-generating enzyme family protein [Bacteroidia bacterium]